MEKTLGRTSKTNPQGWGWLAFLSLSFNKCLVNNALDSGGKLGFKKKSVALPLEGCPNSEEGNG